jgi:predicted metal-dependent peptidase
MTSPAMTKLVANRTRMIFDHVFFGVLATRLHFVEDTSIPTLAVDGKNIFFNPDYVMGLSDSLTRSAIAHEVGHCMFEHFSRRRHREPRRWNQAGDYVINLMLQDAKFEISPTWLLSPVYANMSTDEVYNALPPGDESGGGGNSGPDPQDEVRDGSPADNSIDEAEWKSAVAQAANAAKSRGELPGSVKRFIDELTNPQVPWEEELRAFFTSTDESDYSGHTRTRTSLRRASTCRPCTGRVQG